jgi:maleamate amidohydrolase
VRGPVVDAFADNLKVLVPWDAVYDRCQVSHAVNLFDMSEKYANVMSLAAALERLGQLPA